jgi:tight adherence protein C
MTPMLLVSLAAVFFGVALAAGLVTAKLLSSTSTVSKRLRELEPVAVGVIDQRMDLSETPDPALNRLSKALPKSPKDLGRLRRQLAAAGYNDLSAAVYYSAAKWICPVVVGLLPLVFLSIGVLLPDLVLGRMVRKHAKLIENGLPDVLDLMIVCIEAGSSLDQSIVKASDELELAHPALAAELRIITTEIRAGKPRMEAFHNFSKRTKVEDVRALVTMLVQTDKFGTSVAQALRTHADTSRVKRRQRAEERAAKVGVKLVFPLALCVFPAVYIVCIGPAVISIYRTFF